MNLEEYSKETLMSILRMAVAGIFILDYNGNFLEASNQASNPWRKSEEENLQFYIKRLLHTGLSQSFSYRVLSNTGEDFYKAILSLLDEDRILLTIINETDRSNWEERLREKEIALEESLKISECLFSNSPDAIVRFNNDHEIVSINQEFTRLFGYTIEEIEGKNINRIIDPHNKVSSYGSYEVLEGENILYYDTLRYDKGGNPINVILRGAPIVLNNEIIGGYAIYTDIRQRKKDQEKITHQKKILESLFNYSPDAIGYLDKQGNIIDINKRFTEIFGYTLEECRGKNLDSLIAGENLLEEAKVLSEKVLEGQNVELETIRIAKDGRQVPVSIRGGATIVNGEIIGTHGFYTDITDRKATEEHIKYLSYHDKLTGLYNRAYFEEELSRLNQKCYLPITIIIGDVNGLKLTNDTFGHLEGDRLLIKIAEIIRKSCRRDDVVARWGGDEFAIILPNTPEERAKNICEEIKKRCREAKEDPIKISISLGYGTKYSEEEEINETIKVAEEGMYENKVQESESLRSYMFASLRENINKSENLNKTK